MFAIFGFGEGAAAGGLRLGLSAFAVVHVGLHSLFRSHPGHGFNNPGSWSLILLTGALGAAHLVAASV